MPEYFMPSYVFDHLGDEVTMTLETNFYKLLEWNMGSKSRRQSQPSVQDIRALSTAANLGTPRIDLVIFADPHRPKDEQDILALVEFNGWIAGGGEDIPASKSDRDKLRLVLDHIDTCRYGESTRRGPRIA